MREMESGVALMALRAGVRLLPAYISDRPRLLRPVHVYYGQPLSIADIAAQGVNKEACGEVMERVARAYEQLVEEHGKTGKKKG